MNQLFGLQHRRDRYLGMTAAIPQVPVPTAMADWHPCRHGADREEWQT